MALSGSHAASIYNPVEWAGSQSVSQLNRKHRGTMASLADCRQYRVGSVAWIPSVAGDAFPGYSRWRPGHGWCLRCRWWHADFDVVLPFPVAGNLPPSSRQWSVVAVCTACKRRWLMVVPTVWAVGTTIRQRLLPWMTSQQSIPSQLWRHPSRSGFSPPPPHLSGSCQESSRHQRSIDATSTGALHNPVTTFSQAVTSVTLHWTIVKSIVWDADFATKIFRLLDFYALQVI